MGKVTEAGIGAMYKKVIWASSETGMRIQDNPTEHESNDKAMKNTMNIAMQDANLSLKALVPLVSAAVLLSACGGGGGNSGKPSGGGGSSNPNAILKVGTQRQYVGTTTRNVVYANPTAGEKNNTLSFNFIETTKVLQAPASSGAAFDVQGNYVYTVTKDPGTGTVPVSETIDSYQNLITNGGTQATSTVGELVHEVATDESANALGNGPFTATTVTSYTYPAAIPGPSYPLRSGTSLPLPATEVLNISFKDVNASGKAPSSGGVAYTSKLTKNSDGSYATLTNWANGATASEDVNSNGSATFSSTNGPASFTTTIGQPAMVNGAYRIPVNYHVTSPTASNSNFSAVDWYPGNAQANAPMTSHTKTIIGAVATLPSACKGALTQPNMFEIDTADSILSTAGTYEVNKVQSYTSNGVEVCAISQRTVTDYNVYSGAVESTTTTQSVGMLKSIN